MPMIYKTSTGNISTFKVVLISSSVLSAAIMLTVTNFADYVPSIYNGVVSWLRPPYMYLMINCIIITIVASSKLQSRKDDDPSPSPSPQLLDTMGFASSQPVKSIQTTNYPTATDYKYDGVVVNDFSGYRVKVEKRLELNSYEGPDATKTQHSPLIVNAGDGGGAFAEDAMCNKENEYVMAKSIWNAPENNDLREYSPSDVKLPASARFSHRRSVKASPEGGRTVLGVSKAKRQDTLESTWKTVTEGRLIPVSRHVRKSDTWERDPHLHDSIHNHQRLKTMKKATTSNSPSEGGGGGSSGKLRKESSLTQEELTRRVETFIKKFNEEMRLQRQESLYQYMEMINRGSH